MLADDLVQETITAGMRNYKQLRDENSLFGWICGRLLGSAGAFLVGRGKVPRLACEVGWCFEFRWVWMSWPLKLMLSMGWLLRMRKCPSTCALVGLDTAMALRAGKPKPQPTA